MDLLNENELKENKYSVHVNMGRKVGDITLKVNAKDEKEARSLIAKGLKNPKDIKKVVKEGLNSVNEDVFFESITEGNRTTTHIHWESNGKGHGYTFEYVSDGKLNEAEYQGRKVKLGKVMQGDTKKFKVYVKNPKGNVVKVNFGQGGKAKGGTMRIRKSNPGARKNFRARHNCDNPGPRHKARYWSCKKW